MGIGICVIITEFDSFGVFYVLIFLFFLPAQISEFDVGFEIGLADFISSWCFAFCHFKSQSLIFWGMGRKLLTSKAFISTEYRLLYLIVSNHYCG